MDTKTNGSDIERASKLIGVADLESVVADVVRRTSVIDVHTHLFPAEFERLSLSGIDNLLTYHYLVAEFFRHSEASPAVFFGLARSQQAELIYDAIFVNNTPLSEAARGVLTVINALGIDSAHASLKDLRAYFAEQDPEVHVDRVFELSGVQSVVMTNDPFDDEEIAAWDAAGTMDGRFLPALRMDRPLNDWPGTCDYLNAKGSDISPQLGGRAVADLRRYLDRAVERMKPLYLAASLPDSFIYPSGDIRTKLIEEVVLPLAREFSLPIMLMIGVRRGVNVSLGPAGDGVGRADVSSVEKLCSANPDLRFFVTFLSRENQHELCVSARKFSNLMPFGCWWFLNNPSIISEITSERLELLGTTFIPQHSDSRVLEQLIYKWSHSREVIGNCLTESYKRLMVTGRPLDRQQIERDVENLFQDNFTRRVSLPREPSLHPSPNEPAIQPNIQL
ncbi:MAG: glucuronate isomerase [Pyrinomonadaceae bacterium]